MGWQFGIYPLLATVAVVLLGGFTVVGWQRSNAAASAFGWLTFAGLLWAGCYGIQLGYSTLPAQLPWQRATLAVSALVPPLLLLFSLRYTGRGDQITTRLLTVLGAEFLAFAGLTLTNPAHHLIFTDATLQRGPITPVLELTFGPGYYAHILFAYSVVFVALAVLVSVLFRNNSVYHKQVTLLLIVSMPTFFFHIGYTFGVSPAPGLDLTPFAFSLTILVYGLALFHFDLLNQTPVAQERALELMGEGLVVMDADGTVVNANLIARQVLDIESGVLRFPHLPSGAHPESADNTTITAMVDDSRRVYDCHVSPLHDDYAEVTGYAVALRDVTDRNTYEQRLEVANRILRHNVRNDMNVVHGYAGILEERSTTAEEAEMAITIKEKASGLVSLSEKLRQAIALQQSADGASVSNPGTVLERLLAEFRTNYPTARFELDTDEGLAVGGITEKGLTLAVRNLLDNTVQHNDPACLEVRVGVRSTGDRVRIEVADNGTGLPQVERTVLESRTETPLQHSSGIGLWLTRWIINTSGGEITVGDDSTGTTIILDLPDAR